MVASVVCTATASTSTGLLVVVSEVSVIGDIKKHALGPFAWAPFPSFHGVRERHQPLTVFENVTSPRQPGTGGLCGFTTFNF